jgi:hypothetical protein
MKIQIERSGGFAGITREIMIDSKDLPRYLDRMLKKSQTTKKKSLPLKSNRGADCYHFRVSKYDGKKKINIEFNELDLDEELRSFMNDLFKRITS